MRNKSTHQLSSCSSSPYHGPTWSGGLILSVCSQRPLAATSTSTSLSTNSPSGLKLLPLGTSTRILLSSSSGGSSPDSEFQVGSSLTMAHSSPMPCSKLTVKTWALRSVAPPHITLEQRPGRKGQCRDPQGAQDLDLRKLEALRQEVDGTSRTSPLGEPDNTKSGHQGDAVLSSLWGGSCPPPGGHEPQPPGKRFRRSYAVRAPLRRYNTP